MDDPVLVASTDGVGTKVELAARAGMVRGVGVDIVNHCIDDVLVQSARPLFFLDYIAASELDADLVAEVVTGMAEACEAAGCACSAARRRDAASTHPGLRHRRDVSGGRTIRLLPRDDSPRRRVDRRRFAGRTPTSTRSSAVVRVATTRLRPAVSIARSASAARPHRSYLGVLVVIDGGLVQALAHTRGGCRRTCRGCCRRHRPKSVRFVAGAAAVPAGVRGDWRRHARAARMAQHGHRNCRRVRPAARPTRRSIARRP